MIRVTLDAEQAKKILDAREPVELCDPSGEVLGRVLPNFDPTKWEILGEEVSEEELERRASSNQKRYSTAEVIAYLHSLESP
jgi:hypothetical protein